MDKVVDRADARLSLRDELRNLFGKRNGASAIPADVWVDANGLARRIQLQMDVGAFAGDAAGSGDDAPKITVSMDLHDFGVPVHVVAPPSVDITEFPGASTGTVS